MWIGLRYFRRQPTTYWIGTGRSILLIRMEADTQATASAPATGKVIRIALLVVILYAALGVGFHWKWTTEVEACRDLRRIRGEFVEPGVFTGPIGLAFDVVFWPVYSVANIYHDGTPFATPCTH